MNRLAAAEAMLSSSKLADGHELDQARSALTAAVSTISASPAAEMKQSVILLANLNEALDEMKTQHEYSRVGGRKMKSRAQAHHMQRSNLQAGGYENLRKGAMKSAWRSR